MYETANHRGLLHTGLKKIYSITIYQKSPPLCSKITLVLMIVKKHAIIIRIHMGILTKVSEHLIWHLGHCTVACWCSVHLHVGHHATHSELLLIEPVHHS